MINLNKQQTIEFLTDMLNKHMTANLQDVDSEKLESALRVALAHLHEDNTTKLGVAVEAIFQMYKRDNDVDKAYRNAARYILSVVDDIPSRYESFEDDERPDSPTEYIHKE